MTKYNPIVKVSISSLSHLSDSIGQDLDDLVVRCGDDTLPVDFNYAVPNTDASSLRYTTPHQAADLQQEERKNFYISKQRCMGSS